MESRAVDVIFVIDASKSMEPCIKGVIDNITNFTDVFKDDVNHMWNMRFDFLAHRDMLREERAKGIDKDFRERVVAAGGCYDEVDFRATLIWNNRNDLDLHIETPNGEHIYYGNKKADKGELDVDRNVTGETRHPVENIRWSTGRAPHGTYKVWVNYFARHEKSECSTHFKVEIANGGAVKHFENVFSENSDGKDIYIGNFQYPDLSLQQVGTEGRDSGFKASSVHCDDLLKNLYNGSGDFFTEDIEAFQRSLASVSVEGNECPLLALDCALDFPWRTNANCHRAIIFLTDEPVEGGNRLEESKRRIDDLIEKVENKRVLLFLVAPASEQFQILSEAEGSEISISDGTSGLRDVLFDKLMNNIAKTISKSHVLQQQENLNQGNEMRALFGQDKW